MWIAFVGKRTSIHAWLYVASDARSILAEVFKVNGHNAQHSSADWDMHVATDSANRPGRRRRSSKKYSEQRSEFMTGKSQYIQSVTDITT
jgi:hypothetical protein